MLDQCHNIEAKIPGQIRSVLNVQEMTARALLIDHDALAAAQASNDVLAANAVFMDAFYTDVRPGTGRVARVARASGRPDGGVRGIRIPVEDRSRPRRRHPGRLGRLTRLTTSLIRRSRTLPRDNTAHQRRPNLTRHAKGTKS